jgi:hypothetical protein
MGFVRFVRLWWDGDWRWRVVGAPFVRVGVGCVEVLEVVGELGVCEFVEVKSGEDLGTRSFGRVYIARFLISAVSLSHANDTGKVAQRMYTHIKFCDFCSCCSELSACRKPCFPHPHRSRLKLPMKIRY